MNPRPLSLSTVLTRTLDYCDRAITRPQGLSMIELQEFAAEAVRVAGKPIENVGCIIAADELELVLKSCRKAVEYLGRDDQLDKWQSVVAAMRALVRRALRVELERMRGAPGRPL